MKRRQFRLLVDTANRYRRREMGHEEAIMRGGRRRVRLLLPTRLTIAIRIGGE